MARKMDSSATGEPPRGTREQLEARLKAGELRDPARKGTRKQQAQDAKRRAAKLGAAFRRAKGKGHVARAEHVLAARRGMVLEDLILTVPGWDPYEQAGECYFDQDAAWRAIDFVHAHLTHTKGQDAGKPLLLEPWQVAILANVFGWKRPDGSRRMREVFIYVPRKNGKSTLAAAIILYLLACDGERGAEVYSAAGSKEQAALIWGTAADMIQNRAALRDRFSTYQNGKSIVYRAGGATYKAIPSDAKLRHGFNAHGVVVDEVHVLPNGDLVDVLVTSTGARRQPLVVYVTTADFDRQSVCNELRDTAVAVRDNGGNRDRPGWDPGFMPVVYEAQGTDDWTSPEVWARANPNLGVSLRRDYVEREATKALRSPRVRNSFLRLQLNIRTQAEVSWIPMELWDLCTGTATAESLKGKLCYGGLDLASRKDLVAWCLYFPEEHAVLCRFWWPEQNLRRRVQDEGATWMLEWVEKGFLTLTPGTVTDYEVVRQAVQADLKVYQVGAVGFDRWNAQQIATQLKQGGANLVEVGQGFRDLSEPSKELEALWMAGKLQHLGNPVLRWNAGNTMVREDPAGNIKPDKQKSTGQIDGIVATVMALGLAVTVAAKGQGPSVYESRGMRTL